MKLADNTILYWIYFSTRNRPTVKSTKFSISEEGERQGGYTGPCKKWKEAVEESVEARAVLRLFIDRICLPAN